MPSTIYKGDLAEVTFGHETGIVLTHGAWGGLVVSAASLGDVTTLTFSGTSNLSNGFFGATQFFKYPTGLLAGCKMRVIGGGNYSDDDHTNGHVYTILANEGATIKVTPAMKRTGASTTNDEFIIESLGCPSIDVDMDYTASAKASDERVLTDQFIGLAAEISLPETKVDVFRSHVVGIGRDVVVQEPQSIKNEGGSLSTMMNSARWLYYALGNEALGTATNANGVTVSDDGTNVKAISSGDTYVDMQRAGGNGAYSVAAPNVGDYIIIVDTADADEVLTPMDNDPGSGSRTKFTGSQTQFDTTVRTEIRRVIARDDTSTFKRVYVDDPFNFDHALGKAMNRIQLATNNATGSPNFVATTALHGKIENRQNRALWSMWSQPSFTIETSIRNRDTGSYITDELSGYASTGEPGSATDNKQLTRLYKGCKVKSWSLTADADAEVKMKIDFDALMCYTDTGRLEASNPGDRYTAHRMFENIANNPLNRKKAGIAPNTEKPFFFYNGTITAFGTAIAQVTNFEISGENNITTHLVIGANPLTEARNTTTGVSLEQIPFAGSRNPSLSVEGKVEYSMSMTILPTDPLLWHEFRANRQKGSDEPITLHLVKNGVGSDREEIYIIIDDYIIEEAPLQIPADKGVIKMEMKILPKHVKATAHDTLLHC